MKPLDHIRLIIGVPLMIIDLFSMAVCALLPFSAQGSLKMAAGMAIFEIALGLIALGLFQLVKSPYRKWKGRVDAAVDSDGSGMAYASLGQRIAAGLIDALLFSPLAGVHLLIPHWTRLGVLVSFCVSALYYPYLFFMTSWRGQTVGKMAMGIRVRRTDGSPPDMRTSFRRSCFGLCYYVVYLVGAGIALRGLEPGALDGLPYAKAILVVSKANPLHRVEMMLGMIWLAAEDISMLLNSQCRAIHDLLGGTVVVRSRV